VAAKTLWDALPTGSKIIDLGTTLANNTISAASNEVDNGGSLDTFVFFMIQTSDSSALFDSAPTDAVPSLNIYRTVAPNNTNYEDAPVTGAAGQRHKYVTAFQVEKNTTAVRIVTTKPVLLLPFKHKFYIDNQTGQTLTAEWELHIYPANFESQ